MTLNASYYSTKAKYPWLTPAFIDRVRFQVSRAFTAARGMDYDLRFIHTAPFTEIQFSNNGSHNIQIIHNRTVYNLDKLKADPFKFTLVLGVTYESARTH